MNPYENCLVAIERLLSNVGVKYWADSIRQDIHDWQNKRDTSHHLSTYGGMGSFNDVWICRENRNNVTEAQEAWAQSLFDWLKAVAFYLARHPLDRLSAKQLRGRVGSNDSVLAAFVGGGNVHSEYRGLSDTVERLHGWRCAECGHCEVTNADLERYIAASLMPELVFQASETLTLDALVDRVLNLQIPQLANIRDDLEAVVKSSGITFHKRDDWMRPCPSCGSKDTGLYRWRLMANKPRRFEASDDNLPFVKKITI
jgi:hypothetical protein